MKNIGIDVPNGNLERIGFIDSLKGIAILLVVLGHVLAWQFESYGQSFMVEEARQYPSLLFIWHLIYSFHMPLFFWISGFLSVHREDYFKNTSIFIYIWRKTRGLLLPFVVGGVIFHLITGEAWTQYWFLCTLYITVGICLPLEILQRYPLGKHAGVVLEIGYYILAYWMIKRTQPFFLQLTGAYEIIGYQRNILFFSFVFGVVTRRYPLLWRWVSSPVAYTCSLLSFAGLHYLNLSGLFRCDAMWTRVVMAFTGIIICLHIALSIRQIQVNCILGYLGKHTLEIYLLHFYFVISLPLKELYVVMVSQDMFHAVSMCTLQLVTGVLETSVICILTLTLVWVLRSSKLVSYLLFGKK